MDHVTHRRLLRARIGIVLGLATAAGPVAAQDDGIDWVTVGDAGNRDTLPHEVPLWPDLEVGGVDYEYRIGRTELTTRQHFEYVQAYWPYVPLDERRGHSFTGQWIGNAGSLENPQYYIRSGAADRPTDLSWRHAARLANWLHNGKVEEQWAFEDGAYDTSTFGDNSDGTFTDQLEHYPDAKFWIPTLDEYAKAMFWDPDKDGEGGYWRYPHSKDTAPISGAPWEGGETDAGAHPDDFPPLDAGSYPWAASPWGLLGGSGGATEWTEFAPPGNYDRVWHGSLEYGSDHDFQDRLDYWKIGSPRFSMGVRFAAAVPAPATCVPFAFVLGMTIRKRRQPTVRPRPAAPSPGYPSDRADLAG